MTRRRRILVGCLLLPMAFLIGSGLYTLTHYKQWFRTAITDALADAGLPGTTFNIRQVGFWMLTLDNISTPNDRLEIDSLRIIFSWDGLQAGRAETISLLGCRYELQYIDDRIDWGPLAKVRFSGDGELPFDSIHLHDCILRFHRADQPLTLTGQVVIKNEGDGICQIRLDGTVLDAPLNGTVTLDTNDWSGDTSLQLNDLVAARVFSHLPATSYGRDLTAEGTVSLTLDGQADSDRFRIKATLDTPEEKRLTLSNPTAPLDGSASLAGLSADMEMKPAAQDGWGAQGVVTLTDLNLHLDQYKLNVEAAQGDIPFSWNRPTPDVDTTALTITSVSLDGRALRNLRLHPILTNHTLRLNGSLQILKGARATIQGSGELTPDAPAFDLHASIPRFTIQDPDELTRKFPNYGRFRITGDVAVPEFHLRLKNETTTERVVLNLTDVGIENRKWDLSVDGVTGTLIYDSAPDSDTTESFTLSLAEAQFGALVFRDGAASITGVPPGPLQVQQVEFQWADGRIHARDFTVDLQQGQAAFTARFENVDLKQLLDFAAMGRIDGHGTLNGYWDLTAIWRPETDIQFGRGQLRADPPRGWFQIRHPEDVGAALDLDLSAHADIRDELKRKAEAAIQNFAYNQLVIDFIPKGNSFLTRVQTQGQGPRGDADPLTFGGLTFNINDLENALEYLILRTNAAKTRLETRIRSALAPDTSQMPTDQETQKRQKATERAIDKYF